MQPSCLPNNNLATPVSPHDLVLHLLTKLCLVWWYVVGACEGQELSAKAAGKRQMQAPVVPTPPQQQEPSSSSGVTNFQLSQIMESLNKANEAIAELRKERDQAYQAGLEKAAQLFSQGQSK